MGHSQPLFLYFCLFCLLHLVDKISPMSGFELQISGVGSNHSTNWATTTALKNSPMWYPIRQVFTFLFHLISEADFFLGSRSVLRSFSLGVKKGANTHIPLTHTTHSRTHATTHARKHTHTQPHTHTHTHHARPEIKNSEIKDLKSCDITSSGHFILLFFLLWPVFWKARRGYFLIELGCIEVPQWKKGDGETERETDKSWSCCKEEKNDTLQIKLKSGIFFPLLIFQNSANISATDGSARIFAYRLMLWRDSNPRRAAPDWDLWRMQYRLERHLRR